MRPNMVQFCVLSAILAATLLSTLAEAQVTNLYYSLTRPNGVPDAEEGIYVSDLDGSNAQVIIPGVRAFSFVVSEDRDTIYFIEDVTRELRRARLDGSGMSTILSTGFDLGGFNMLLGLAVDFSNSRIYYTRFRVPTEVRRVDLNGNNDQSLVSVTGGPNGVAVDASAGLMFWTNSTNDTVSSADLDGNNQQLVHSGTLDNPIGIALDSENQHVYVASPGSGEIVRVDYDGSNPTILVTGQANCQEVSLDLDAGHIYWGGGNAEVIRRSNLDGTGLITIVPSFVPTNPLLVRGIAPGPPPVAPPLPVSGTAALALLFALSALVGIVYLRRIPLVSA